MIVQYNNDLNYMPLPNFTGRQQDLFFSVISQIQDKHKKTPMLKKFFDINTRELVIPYSDFAYICGINQWNRNYAEVNREIEKFLNILLDYKISYRTKNAYYAFVCFEEAKHDYNEQHIKIIFQKSFYDMVVNYSLGFTSFELAEFIALSSKYTKTLYRLLKQYRSTGELYIEWQEFVKVMDIPKSYAQIDIDKQILKPAIKELTKELTLFDNKRIPFKNLTYQKIKAGVGNKVIAIAFKFEKSVDEYQQFRYKETPLFETKEQNHLNQYIGKYIIKEINGSNETFEILNIHRSYENDGSLQLIFQAQNIQSGNFAHLIQSCKNELELKQFLERYCKNAGEIETMQKQVNDLVKQTFKKL